LAAVWDVKAAALSADARGFGPASEVGDSRLSNMSTRNWIGLGARQLQLRTNGICRQQ
jgi:hypothetical protein